MKIAGCIIIYGKEQIFLENIKSYEKELDKIYIYDNNETSNLKKRIPQNNKFVYITEYENKGIAYALNYCANLARKDGYQWLLTMDQDSIFQSSIQPMIDIAKESDRSVALIAPTYDLNDFYEEEKLVAMTSGNLINLDIHYKIGGFKEYFFIDLVDYEYCLNLRKENYDIVFCKDVILKHRLGNINSKRIFGKTVYYTNHNPQRRYYITRNRLILNDLYKKYFPNFCKKELKNSKREMVKVILFEKNKLEKIKMYIKAHKDYKKWSKEYEK